MVPNINEHIEDFSVEESFCSDYHIYDLPLHEQPCQSHEDEMIFESNNVPNSPSTSQNLSRNLNQISSDLLFCDLLSIGIKNPLTKLLKDRVNDFCS